MWSARSEMVKAMFYNYILVSRIPRISFAFLYCVFFPVTGMNTWMNNWQRNDWTTASGGEVKNRADFERLNHASQGMNVTYVSEST